MPRRICALAGCHNRATYNLIGSWFCSTQHAVDYVRMIADQRTRQEAQRQREAHQRHIEARQQAVARERSARKAKKNEYTKEEFDSMIM